ncbi:methyltransferase domain-containing protein [Acinetobacter baumannii]|uniref:class I SAM-dependent methyltransferase n=1 Tax=Acinetobacter baumannii TaxID=470 RepID=UPI00028D1068|nr:class I SAM-dependent methyltransferase [Acinetobacter baumannii]EHU1480701.1 methyltransferase domain-containing protein [Acinetobacter baumannii]EHU2701092.1 methyltransferase domain-containing protein [Acinetobacter baumannii]EIB6893265.1 methyltransferase domain-containing protein [Acinetobacter baumannii]EIB6895989.1 methyltransferase domain-containing protein [Acinetobacter baumannii]EKK14427.1 ribosomal protein L11 methyltransferase-like protein [Acinetobacter baumannii Naval-72]
MLNQHEINLKQYQNKSLSYLNSTAHSEGVEFDKFIKEIDEYPNAVVLDLGCGGGHVAYNVARHADLVFAYDLSHEMLDTVSKAANARKIKNIFVQQGIAEDMPFTDEQFDVIISRYSAHHWQHVPTAMKEINRVLKPNGIVIFVDIISSSFPILDTFLQTIEVIRDPSHVRNYSIKDWVHFIEDAGFELTTLEKQTLKLDFDSWVQRMKTPEDQIKTLRYLQENAADVVKKYFNIQKDGSFESKVGYFVFKKLSF